MKVSNETAKKVEMLEKLKAEAYKLETELKAEFADYFDGCYIEDFRIDDEPFGDHQHDGEYCDQYTGYSMDTGSGVYYYPIEGSNKYVGVLYTF